MGLASAVTMVYIVGFPSLMLLVLLVLVLSTAPDGARMTPVLD